MKFLPPVRYYAGLTPSLAGAFFPPRARTASTIQGQLTWLVLCALLPFVLLLAGIIAADFWSAREAAAQRVQEVARGTALAVERELRATIVSLETLAMSQSLLAGDMVTFRHEADMMVRRAFPGASIALLDLDGQQFFNTFKPPGAPLPRRPNMEALDRVKASGAPAVSDVFLATLQQVFIVPVDVPVFGSDGQLRAVLSLAPPLQTFADIISQQRPQPGWIVSVLDRQGVVVARNVNADRFVGRPAMEAFRRLTRERPEGTADVVSLDGTTLLAGWSRPGSIGWTVAIGIPHAQFYSALWRTIAATLAISMVTLFGALLLARLIAGRIAAPVQALARLAGQPIHAADEPSKPLGLQEADAVLAALRVATRERQAAEAQLRDLEMQSRAELERRIEERTAELKAMQMQLIQSQRMEVLGQLTAGIAHDFNNLLQAQMVGLDLLLRRVSSDETAVGYAEMAIASCERGAKLTHSLLSFSRQQVLRPEPVSVLSLLERLRVLLSRTLDPRIALRIDVAEGIGPPLADPAHLEAALLNLCLNARDAMKQRGGELLIEVYDGSTSVHDAPDELDPAGCVVFAVADEGTGMDDATLARACEPFFTTKNVGAGSGLGLAMVQGYARQSGGGLRLRSWPGTGTRIEVWLPRAERDPCDDVGAGPVAPARMEPAMTPTMAGSGTRLMLVDDNAAIRALLADTFSLEGYSVADAGSGEDALAMLQAGQRIDLLVTDYAMPGMTGTELIRQARRLQPMLPALVITGYAEGVQISQMPANVQILHKPFQLDKLTSRVRDMLAATEATRAQ